MTAEVRSRAEDEELVARFRRDPQLFVEVHDRHFREIHRYVAGRLDAQVADDITAETFCVAFGDRDRFDPARGTLRAWLFGIATNLIAGHRRKEARRYRALARISADPAVDSHEDRVVTSVAAGRLRPHLLAALAALSKGERDVVLLVALSDLSYEEVGQALGISPGTVGSRLSRARRKLHDAIDRENVNGR